MSVDIAAGDAHLELPSTAYSFWSWTDAVTNLAFTTANVTNPRYDTVVAWVDTTVTSLSLVNSPGSLKFKVIAGTAAGAPAVLADSAIQSNLGAGIAWIRLADCLRPAGVDNVTNGNITDTRSPIRLRVSASTKTIELTGLNGGAIAGSLVTDASGSVSVKTIWGEETGRNLLNAPSATLSVTFPARKYVEFDCYISGLSASAAIQMTFNSDAGANYTYTINTNGSIANASNTNNFSLDITANNLSRQYNGKFVNIANREKLVLANTNQVNTGTGAGNPPAFRNLNGKWTNSTNQVTTITFTASSGTISADSELIVRAHD